MRISLLTGFASVLVMVFLPAPAFAESFQDALAAAYKRSPRLMAERARLREVDENYVQAKAAGRFNLNLDSSLGLSSSETSQTFNGQTNSSVFTSIPKTSQFVFVQPLYQGGRVNGLKAQARAGVLAARQSLRGTEQDTLFSAASAYINVMRDEEAAKIRRNNVRVLARQKEAAQHRFDVGEGTLTDIAQANARLAQADAGLAQADAQLASSRAAYVRYMGHVPQELTRPPHYILPSSLSEAKQRGRQNNPQMVAMRYGENAAQAAINVARAAGRPIVSLNGTLQGSRDTSSNLPRAESASITAQVRIPIYQGGMNKSRVRAAKHARIRSKFETREMELVIDEAIANLWAQVDAAKRSLSASRKQVEAGSIAYEGVQLEQEVGTRNTLDVLNAEQELLDAKLAVVQAERNLNATQYQLLVTMGGFDAYSLQLPVQASNPEDNFLAVGVSPLNKYVPVAIKKFAQQKPVMPVKMEPFDPNTHHGDPEAIDPKPILIVTQKK